MRRIDHISSKRATFEQLETRQLLSTVNVADYGAIPNDGQDDLAAIQRAINDSNSGDTILFSGGTFDLSNGLKIPGDRTYQGTSGAILKGRGHQGQLFTLHSSNVTFTGLTFYGGGIFIDKSGGGFNQNIVIDGNWFQLATRGVNPSGVTFTSGLQNSRITNNHFTGYSGGGYGIYGYKYNGLTIANNEFVNIAAGMHIDAFTNSGNLLVEQNYISGTTGMGMEFQSSASNLIFQDNWFENPALSSNFSRNNSSMAFSLILDKSKNVLIQRNVVIAPQRPDGVGCRIGFEVGGDNALVTDNYVNGINHVVAMNDGSGSASVTVQNNKFMNYRKGTSAAFPAKNRSLTQTNNGPDVQLSNVMQQRIAGNDKPGVGNKRYDGVGTLVPEALPQPEPTVASAPAPAPAPEVASNGLTYLSELTWTSASNGWGPVERDMHTGGRGADDGGVITMNGNTYAKGLGAAVNSEIIYNLGGNYSKFFSDIGIDDSAARKGSATFQIWADGVKIFDSGVIRGSDKSQRISVNVRRAKELKLITTDAGDGGSNDRADWGAARLSPAL